MDFTWILKRFELNPAKKLKIQGFCTPYFKSIKKTQFYLDKMNWSIIVLNTYNLSNSR